MNKLILTSLMCVSIVGMILGAHAGDPPQAAPNSLDDNEVIVIWGNSMPADVTQVRLGAT